MGFFTFLPDVVYRTLHFTTVTMIRVWTVKWHYYFIMIANIVGLFLGIFMLIRPVAALISLSYLIGIDLILLGIDSIILAFSRMGSDW